MKSDFMEIVKEVFENPENMNTDQIQKLLAETNNFFASMEKIMQSDDAQARDEALASAIELKQFLESKITTFSPFIGKEPTEEEQAMIAEISEDLKVVREIGKSNKLKPIKMS